MNAIPTLLEGTGTAAAQEALAEALSMLEQPSELTPVDDSTTVEREIVMLWLSEGPFTSALVMSPDVASNPHYQGYVRLSSAIILTTFTKCMFPLHHAVYMGR